MKGPPTNNHRDFNLETRTTVQHGPRSILVDTPYTVEDNLSHQQLTG